MFRNLKTFEYLEPGTVGEAVQLLSSYGTQARVLAGGVDLVNRMRLRQIKPDDVVSLGSITELEYVKVDEGKGIRIGALATLRSLERSQTIQNDIQKLGLYQLGLRLKSPYEVLLEYN